MQGGNGAEPSISQSIADHVQCDAAADMLLGANAIDGLLHLAVAAVAAFNGIGGGGQKGLVEEGQRLFDGRREELVEWLA